ncbi:hypothetical protein AQI96_14800 [Streptomyces canus]|nr:hypothetical protein AQI96_14800 [Streptomyces canus]
MHTTRTVPARPVLLIALTGSLLLTPNSASADPEPPTRESAGERGVARAPESAPRRALTAPVTGFTDTTRGCPREQVLTPGPVNPADRSVKPGLTPHHAIAPRLNALQGLGDRVSVEVAGRPAGGHRLFLGAGHGLVGRGVAGAELSTDEGLPAAKPVEGNGDANGVGRVVNSGPVTAGAPGSPDHGFVYAPVWFTDLGPGVRVEQSYATGSPLVSGHWRPLPDGSGGPAAAARQASVVSGKRAVLFGTEPLFRDHPKGEFAQVGRALFTMAHASSGRG